MKILTSLLLTISLAPSALAQLAVDTAPGITNYGDTRSYETAPGVRRFYGATEGSAVEIAPGVRHYNLQPNLNAEVESRIAETNAARTRADAWSRDLQERHRREDQSPFFGMPDYLGTRR